MSDNMSSLSENIISNNNSNNNNNHHPEDIENWLQELFDPHFSAIPLVGAQCSAAPVSSSVLTKIAFIQKSFDSNPLKLFTNGEIGILCVITNMNSIFI